MAGIPKYSVDTSVGKAVIMNGMKLPGVNKVGIEVSADDVVTQLTLTMCVRKDSIIWDREGIRFQTITDPTPARLVEPQAPRIRRTRVQE